MFRDIMALPNYFSATQEKQASSLFFSVAMKSMSAYFEVSKPSVECIIVFVS